MVKGSLESAPKAEGINEKAPTEAVPIPACQRNLRRVISDKWDMPFSLVNFMYVHEFQS
jgi:hypothetical protein